MRKQMKLVDKLRLYALKLRLQELIVERELRPFYPEPMIIKPIEFLEEREVYNLNYEPAQSKFMGKPKNNFKIR